MSSAHRTVVLTVWHPDVWVSHLLHVFLPLFFFLLAGRGNKKCEAVFYAVMVQICSYFTCSEKYILLDRREEKHVIKLAKNQDVIQPMTLSIRQCPSLFCVKYFLQVCMFQPYVENSSLKSFIMLNHHLAQTPSKTANILSDGSKWAKFRRGVVPLANLFV